MNQDWLNSSEFKELPPMKQALLKALMIEGKGKSPEEILPAFMKANTELNKRGTPFTNQETNMIVSVLKESMSPNERKKFEMLQKFMAMQ